MTNMNPPQFICKIIKNIIKYCKYAISERALPQRVGPF